MAGMQTDILGRPVAGFFRRVVATAVDTVVLLMISSVVLVGYWLSPLHIFGHLSIWWLFTGGLLWGQVLTASIRGIYFISCWMLRSQTIGNRAAFTLVVDRRSGRPVTLWQATIRFLVQFGFHLIPALGPCVDNLWSLVSADRQTLHDKAAKTVVVCMR